MLSPQARPFIDASVPVLKAHGLAITTRFYERLFQAHPHLRQVFNMGNQANGLQQQSLAAAVFAYAAHIDQPQVLAPVIERIVHKHASVGIRPDHYPLVGEQLLGAIADVLGDAATPGLIAAWAEAYGLLADTLIAAEAQLYQQSGQAPGEQRPLRVCRTEVQSDSALSLYLQDEHGQSPGPFVPGQYITVTVDLPGLGLSQGRQYSLSDAPHQPWWRITVKREAATTARPQGMVSTHLHDHIQVGDALLASPAFGDFQPVLTGDVPLVLLSAGVGITPMVSVLNALVQAQSTRPIRLAHAVWQADQLAHHADLAAAQVALPGLSVQLWHEQGPAVPGNTWHAGRMDLNPVLADLDLNLAQVYLCGPVPFMQAQRAALLQRGVPAQHIHREVFGPDLLDGL